MKKFLLSAIAITTFGMFSANAQLNITITQADFAQANSDIVMMVDTTPNISVGSAGASQAWDFTSLLPLLMDTNRFTTPDITGLDAEFTNANIKWETSILTSYLNSSAQSIEVEGILAKELNLLGFQIDLGLETAFPFDNSLSFVKFPAVLNDIYEDTATFTYAMDGAILDQFFPAGTIDSIRTRHTSLLNSTMDADGVVTNPGDSAYDALRQFKTEYRTDTIEILVLNPLAAIGLAGFGINVTVGEWSLFEYAGIPNPIRDTLYTYSWYANNQDFPVVTVEVDKNDNPLRASWVYTNNLMAMVKGNTNSSCAAASNGSVNVNVIGGTTPYSYAWDNGETTAKGSKLSSGNHTLTVTDNGSETFIVSATVEANPNFSVALSTTTMTCNDCDNGAVSISGAGGQSPYTYNWSNGATTESISSLSGGSSYAVTVTDKNGCSATASTYISGIKTVSNNEVDLYPNPVNNGVLNIRIKETSVSIYNMIGELLKSETVFGNQTRINVDEFPSGLYLIQFKSANGTTTRKVTIE